MRISLNIGTKHPEENSIQCIYDESVTTGEIEFKHIIAALYHSFT